MSATVEHESLVVIDPLLIDGLNEETYHADPVAGRSLSVSGAKRLLPPSCPAIFKWERDNGRPNKAAFDVGHAAHGLVLGTGGVVEVLQTDVKKATKTTPAVIGDAKNRMSTYTKDHDAEIRKAGKVPLLREEWEQVQAMTAAILAHPIASVLLDPAHGKAEQSIFFRDEPTGVSLRSRLDWLPETDGGRLIIPDLKTALSAEPKAFGKAAANFGYAMQDDFYRAAVRSLGIAEDIAFVFIVVEKAAPYVVTVCELDAEAKRYGAAKNRQAIDLYARCMERDEWPGYTSDVALVSLPKWATYDLEDYAA